MPQTSISSSPTLNKPVDSANPPSNNRLMKIPSPLIGPWGVIRMAG